MLEIEEDDLPPWFSGSGSWVAIERSLELYGFRKSSSRIQRRDGLALAQSLGISNRIDRSDVEVAARLESDQKRNQAKYRARMAAAVPPGATKAERRLAVTLEKARRAVERANRRLAKAAR